MKNFIIAAVLLLANLAAAGHSGFEISELAKAINANIDKVPTEARQLLGNERINLFLEDAAFGIVTQNGKIVEYQEGELKGPTINLYTTSDVIAQIIGGKLKFTDGLASGKIRYEAIDAVTKVKMIIGEIARMAINLITGKGSGKAKQGKASQAKEVTVTCMDSESGESETIAGNVTLNYSTGRIEVTLDSCVNQTTVNEVYCAPPNSGAGSFYREVQCSSGKMCINGACIDTRLGFRCIDSDSGANLASSGTTITSTVSGNVEVHRASDSCSSELVHEYYCANSTSPIISTIDARCPTGQTCIDGVCSPTATQYRCFDSDGVTPNTDGEVTILSSNGERRNARDSCTNDRTLTEYSCNVPDSQNPTSRTVNCGTGETCANHLCIPTVSRGCFDSEKITTGINDAYLPGYVHNSTGYRIDDACEGETSVREYYCDDGRRATSSIIRCSTGEACVQGACRPTQGNAAKYHCHDSDGGANEFVKGRITVPAANGTTYFFHDSCFNSNIVEEKSCSSETTLMLPIVTTYQSCWPGQTCVNGACVYTNGANVLQPPVPVTQQPAVQRGTYLYPLRVLRQSGIVNAENSLDDDSDYATLQFNIAPAAIALGGGFHRTSVTENTTATNIASIQVNFSELNLQCVSRACEQSERACISCNQDVIIRVRAIARCMGSTSAFPLSSSFKGMCYAGDNETGQLCNINLGTQGCASGLWEVNNIEIEKTSSISGSNGPAAAVHWVRVERIP